MIVILGYGFLGRALYHSLKVMGSKVVVISRNFDDTTNPDFITSGLDDMSEKLFELGPIGTVIHCFHTTVPVTSMEDHIFDIQSNVIPFIHLMSVCKKLKVDNFIYISSGGAVYGNPINGNSVDESHPTNPISSYGITKLTCEKYLLMNKRCFDGNCVVIRPSNIFGNGQKTDKPQGIMGFIQYSIKNNKAIEIWGDGDNKKDYLFLDDFVDGIIKVLFCNKKLEIDTYNIGSGNLYSVNKLINLFEIKYNLQATIEYKGQKEFDVCEIALNSQLFKKTFNWNKSTTVEEYIYGI